MDDLQERIFLKLIDKTRVRLQILNVNPAHTDQIWNESGSYTVRQLLEQKIRYLEHVSASMTGGTSSDGSGPSSNSLDIICFSPQEPINEYEFNLARYSRYCSIRRALTRQMQTKRRLLDLAEHGFMEEFISDVAKNKFVQKWESSRQEQQAYESSSRCEAFQQDATSKEQEVAKALQAGRLTQDHYNFQIENIQQTIAEWTQRFEREKDDLEARFQRARAKKNHWDDMKTLVEQRKEEIRQLELRELAHLERIAFRELCKESATKIQAWWRGIIVRKGIVLGRKRRRIRKKKKQRGAKKAKKPEDTGKDQCGGTSQSPIALSSLSAIPMAVEEPSPLELLNYHLDPSQVRVENTGHAVNFYFEYPDGAQVIAQGGPLSTTFQLFHLHFHWGKSSERGSEHSLDGKIYSMEMHLVFFNNKDFSSFDEAKSQPNGLAVLGVFFQNSIVRPEYGWIEALSHVRKAGTSYTLPDPTVFNIKGLLGARRKPYFSYKGSLTVSPCYESVNWLVAAKPLRIAEDQLQEFRALRQKDGEPLVDNFRALQDINERPVYLYRDDVSGLIAG